MSRRLAAVLLVVLGVVAGTAGGGPFVVRKVAEAQALERGAWVAIDTVRPAWGGFWLVGVRGGLLGDDSLRVDLNALQVSVSLGGGLRSLEGAGGSIAFRGSLEALKRRLFPREGNDEPSGRRPLSERKIALSGLEIGFLEGGFDGSKIWGARYDRGQGRETLGADRVEANVDGLRLSATSLEVVTQSGERGRVLSSVTAGSLSIDVDFDQLSVPSGRAAAGVAAATPQPVRSAPDRGSSDASDVDPSAAVSVATPAGLSTWTLRLRERLRWVVAMVAPWLRRDSRVELAGVRVRVHRPAGVLNLGPANLNFGRDADSLSVEFIPGATAQGGQVRLVGRVPLGDGEVVLELGGGPVTLAQLGVQEGDWGLHQVTTTLLDLETKLSLSADGKRLALDASGSIDRLSLHDPRLANISTEGIQLGWRGQAQVVTDGSSLAINDAELRVGRVGVQLSALLQRAEAGFDISVQVSVPRIACEAILASIPEALIPLIAGARSKGTFALDASLAFKSTALADIALAWDVDNHCRIVDPPAGIDPRNFLRPFEYRVYGPDGRESSRTSGPGTLDWVPLPEISSHMETAVLVSEDSRFWHHQGFDPKAIKSSITDNLRAGRFVRGASTISMQLAKNLYLAREKTLSRKLQEVALTMLLEQELRKDELLELYFNVIEYGPNVFGIRAAADYYFGVEPRDLSLAQAMFLGSILPQPRARYFDDDGRLKARRAEYLARLMHIARKIERITDEELQQGLAEELVFVGARERDNGLHRDGNSRRDGQEGVRVREL